MIYWNDWFYNFYSISDLDQTLLQKNRKDILLRRNLNVSCFLSSKKDDSFKDDSIKDNSIKDNSIKGGVHKEDYIDENPELQKILRDLYSEPVDEHGLLLC